MVLGFTEQIFFHRQGRERLSLLGRIMRSTKANIVGLASPLQQAEMKSILSGTWPPLKPLPVFKYETAEYRATIDFDRKRGEWVCRKTSFPSNQVQELRGGLREITLALPHDEAEIFTEGVEPQEQELEKDANRRLQAIQEWRASYESGALYFELYELLTENQRSEIEDSLRLSLTARQLQFNAKNVANVFDVLSTAGGRFATLIELAKQNKAKQRTAPQAQAEAAVYEAESAIDHDEPVQGICSPESELVLADNDPSVCDQEAAARRTETDELPAVSIKNVLPEQEQPSMAEPMASHSAPGQFEVETSEMVDTHSVPLVELPYQEEHHAPAFTGFAAQVPAGQASADHRESSSLHIPALEISAFQVAVFAALFFSAAFAFTVGLTVGRGPLTSRLREAPKSIPAMDAKSPTVPDVADESASRISATAVTIANGSGSTSRPDEATPSKRKPEENTRDPEYFAKARSTDSDSSESTLSGKREMRLGHSGATNPGSPAPRRLTATMSAAPKLARPSTILVTRPSRASQPFRVSFPEKAIAATSSLAMSSQLSVFVFAEPALRVAHRSARLEAGDLVSLVWPRYPKPEDRYGVAETIKVCATIGQLGQVREVKFLSGSRSLLPATKAAIQQWRYRPTLLDKRPVQAQQEVTIEFRPPQFSSQVLAQHPSHN
jgi:TonB-like protein